MSRQWDVLWLECYVLWPTHAALLRRRRRRRFGYVQNFLGNLHCQKVVDSTRNLTILWLRSHCAGRGSQSFIRLIYCVAYDIGIMPVWGGGKGKRAKRDEKTFAAALMSQHSGNSIWMINQRPLRFLLDLFGNLFTIRL